MAFKLNPFTGKLETSEPGPKGDTGTVAAAGDGSQGTPSISFTSDPDTGFYKYTTNGIGVSTAGTGRLFVDASGDVGIGTGSPNKNSWSGPAITLQCSTNGAYEISDGNTLAAAFALQGDDRIEVINFRSGPLTFKTGNNERLRIDSSGNVGIGTSSPNAILVTKPSGAFSTAVSTFTGDGLSIDSTNLTAGSGNFGPGISWPSLGAGGNRQAGICSHQDTADPNRVGLAFFTHPSNSSTDPIVEALRISSAGNVGVGTTSPANTLHVSSSSSTPAKIQSTGSTGSFLNFVNTNNGNGYIGYDVADLTFYTANTEKVRIDSSGRVGIGTSSPYSVAGANTLSVHNSSGNSEINFLSSTSGFGALYFGDATSGADRYAGYLEYKHGDDYMRIATGSIERMRIDSSGNVGIGTSSPISSGKLTVDSGSSDNFAYYQARGANSLESSLLFLTKNSSGTNVGGSIGHDGSTNTLYLTGLTTGASTQHVSIDSSGRLGIGTTSPSEMLEIYSISDHKLKVSRPGVSIELSQPASASPLLNASGTNVALRFSLNDSEVARFDSSGRLLVGTTSNAQVSTIVAQGNSGASNGAAVFYLNNGETTVGNGSSFGLIRFADSSSVTSAQIAAQRDGGTWTSGSSQPSRLTFSTTADGAAAATERMRIDSSGRIGVGTTAPDKLLTAEGATTPTIKVKTTSSSSYSTSDAVNDANDYIQLFANGSARAAFGALGTGETGLVSSKSLSIMAANSGQAIKFATGGSTERARIDSSGRLLVGTSSSPSAGDGQFGLLVVSGHTLGAACYASFQREEPATSITNDETIAWLNFGDQAGNSFANIKCIADADAGSGDYPGRLVFSTTADGASSPTERMRITSAGDVFIGRTSDTNSEGISLLGNGFGRFVRDSATPLVVNRQVSDGVLISLQQGGAVEGDISVSGSTVSFNGAHLSRWSQLPGGAERTEILRGSVLSNIDEMCEWGEEENEQLNRMKVSDVEGDKNVSGVFQAWDDDDDTYTNDFYCAMTGDFVIRIAQGVTVERGDLLMSAGDGTAKPQDDDIIRSKTIAKVTSTNVSCTYDDGSYCVPCVLMAC